MKKFILFLPLLIVASLLSAQELSESSIDAATAEAVKLFNLKEDQIPEMRKIQERRLRNLQEIASLKNSDYNLYVQKKSAVRQGTEASLSRLLSEEQKTILTSLQIERRKRASSLIRKMKQEGASPEEIKQAVMALD
jgi:hypothetical protein